MHTSNRRQAIRRTLEDEMTEVAENPVMGKRLVLLSYSIYLQ